MTSTDNTPPASSTSGSVGAGENAIELKAVEGKSQGQIVRERFFRHTGAMVSLVVLGAVLVLAYSSVGVGPIPGWWKFDYTTTNDVLNRGQPTLGLPTWLGGSGLAWGEHPFGQDTIGKDNFAMVMRGVQVSFNVTIIIGLVAGAIGIVFGAVSGFFRGFTDGALMRFTDLIITFPVIVVGAVLGKLAGGGNWLYLALALGAITWTSLARLVRAEFLTLREREFVDAARVAGASNTRIMFKHMLPNAAGVIIVNTTLLMSIAVLLETALSFLGFGITQPEVSLGQLISEYQSAFTTRPWLFWWPGLFIIIIVLSINFIGDGLRDAFDPRQKKIPSAREMDKALAAQESTSTSRVGAGAGRPSMKDAEEAEQARKPS
ncbi:ABC transporter permease [Nocardioidaceae bacterium]|nr:ABC transporter permease [Nocardioidaceae bacterium]